MLINLRYMLIFCHFMMIALIFYDHILFIHVYAITLSLHIDDLFDHHIHGMKIYHYNMNIIYVKEFRCSVI